MWAAGVCGLVVGLIGPALAFEADSCGAVAYYNGTNLTLTGHALKAELHSLVAGQHEVLPYTSSSETDCWDALIVLDADPANASRVLELYTQTSENSHNQDSDGWNREHLWPKSYGVGYSGADYTDLHHLRAADWTVNSARGNKYFGWCSPTTDSECVSPAHAEAANDTAANPDLFVPPAAVRGDIARALFYMEVRYDAGDANTENLTLSDCPCQHKSQLGNLSTLLTWHDEDPPSTAEQVRNNRTCALYQGNRNPFIDFPDLVTRIWDDPALAGARHALPCDEESCTVDVDDSEDDGNWTDTPTAAPTRAEHNISAGDVVVVGMNSDTPDTFTLLVLKELSGGARLHITDKGWDGTTNALSSTEGVITLTVPDEGLAAGETVTWTRGYASNYTWSETGSFSLSTAGDQVLVFVNSEDSPTFVYALSTYTGGWLSNNDTITSTSSALPPGLAINYTSVVFSKHQDNFYHNGTMAGSVEKLLRCISTPSQWSGSNIWTAFPSTNSYIVVDTPTPTSAPTEPIKVERGGSPFQYSLGEILTAIALLAGLVLMCALGRTGLRKLTEPFTKPNSPVHRIHRDSSMQKQSQSMPSYSRRASRTNTSDTSSIRISRLGSQSETVSLPALFPSTSSTADPAINPLNYHPGL